MAKIVLFNGPPYSGKDTFANMVSAQKSEESAVVKFATPIKNAVRDIYCLGDNALFAKMDSAEFKDTPSPVFFGKSCREVQIEFSESYMKKVHGEAIFGQLAVREMRALENKGKSLFLVSDSGFTTEAKELIKAFGANNVMLFRLHREGYDFSKDSRSYIDLSEAGVEAIDITNKNDEVNYALPIIMQHVTEFVEK